MKKFIIASIIAASTAAHAEPAAKRTAPAFGSVEQLCVSALINEHDALQAVINAEAAVKRSEEDAVLYQNAQPLTPTYDVLIKQNPAIIERNKKIVASRIEDAGRLTKAREQICAAVNK